MQALINNTTSTLRGDGCGSFRMVPHTQRNLKSDIQDIENFIIRFDSYVEKISTKAAFAANQSESQEIMIAIKWFIFQEENIYELNKNARKVMKSYTLIVEGIRKLLKSCLIYIRTDQFKCLYILQITTSLSKVIFSFYIMNGERFMKCDLQKEFMDISDELKQQIEIEKNDLIQIQMELYLFLTKLSFQIAPNNSNEREDILKGCSSVLNCLNHCFRKPAYFTKCMQCRKIEIYEVYYQIDMLQWEIIGYFKNDKQQNLEEIILQTQVIHENLVQNSNNWKNHQLWIQMIGKILIYNPLLTQQQLYQLTSSFDFGAKSTQMWKEYQNKGLLIQMNHSKDQAVILLNQLQNKQLPQQDRLILEDCFKEWENLILPKDFLLYQQNQNIHFTFGSYLKCKLQVGQKNENILAVDQIQIFFDFIISNKLLELIQENYEKLGGVVKIYRNFKKAIRSLMRGYYNPHIIHKQKRSILTFKEYQKNTQNIIKIIRLNSKRINCQSEKPQQKKLIEYNNFQQLRINTDEMERLYEQKEFIQVEVKKLEYKDQQNSLLDNLLLRLSGLTVASLKQKKFLEVAKV